MEKQNDIRWIQRFQNYSLVFKRLEESVLQSSLNELEKNGLIQRFEFTLELSWKVLKDFLEEKGFSFKPSPKDTIRLAQESSYIDYAEELIEGLEIRNILSHDYCGEKFLQLEKRLREKTFPALKKLFHFFEDQLKYD